MYVYMCCVCELHMLRGFGGGGGWRGISFFLFQLLGKMPSRVYKTSLRVFRITPQSRYL